jgi:hypothetical protein
MSHTNLVERVALTSWNSLGFWAVGLLTGTAVAELLAFLPMAGGG